MLRRAVVDWGGVLFQRKGGGGCGAVPRQFSTSREIGVGRILTGLVCLPANSTRVPGTYVSQNDVDRLTAASSFNAGSLVRLYVCPLGAWEMGERKPSLDVVLKRLKYLYNVALSVRENLDVRILVPTSNESFFFKAPDCNAPELQVFLGEEEELEELDRLNLTRAAGGVGPVQFANIAQGGFCPALDTYVSSSGPSADQKRSDLSSPSLPGYNSVILGGTFDRLHSGHKLLLSAAAICSKNRVTIGVASDDLLRNKSSAVLVQPRGIRTVAASSFVRAIKPSLEVEMLPITDPVGPAGTKKHVDCIVVSEETVGGGHYCNQIRKQNGLSQMKVLVAGLVQAGGLQSISEDGNGTNKGLDASIDSKASSSILRQQELGKFRGNAKEWSRRTDISMPYVLGLTGGVSTGKSTVTNAMENLGVGVLDCDKIAHEMYLPNTECFAALVDEFGAGIIDSTTGHIDRAALGSIVFVDDGGYKRRKLERIVWPATKMVIKERLRALKGDFGYDIVMMEAAVILEAGWDEMVDEVWSICIPTDIQVKRLMRRDGLTRPAAEARIASQMSHEERASRSHVVLVSQWDKEETVKQTRKAFEGALERSKLDCTMDIAAPGDVDKKPHASLKERWASLVWSMGGDEELIRKWWRVIHDSYELLENHSRFYHTLEHIDHFHTRFRTFRGAMKNPEICELALFFHDIVYDTTRLDNEARSAQLFTKFCHDFRNCVRDKTTPHIHLEAACEQILRTAYHTEGPADGDMAFFLDSDLQIFGSSPSEYAMYAEQIRYEFAHVPDERYHPGRARLLRRFLEQDELFFSKAMLEENENIARQNISSELERLVPYIVV